MLTHDIATMTTEVDAHLAADLLIQGTYFNSATGKGCFIGCLAHSSKAATLTERFGIPLILVRVLENIFEALPFSEASAFFAAIPRAIGKDLIRVVWAFLASELRHLPKSATTDAGIVGMDLLADGKEWPAARAATYTAGAPRLRQRDLILNLMETAQ